MTVTGSREALEIIRSMECECDSFHGHTCGRCRALSAPSPDPAGVTLTLEEIARLFAEHVRLVPVDPDGYARHAEYIDNIDDDLCWKVKSESKDAFATAILSLIQSKMVQPSIATMPATSGTAAPVCELRDGGAV